MSLVYCEETHWQTKQVQGKRNARSSRQDTFLFLFLIIFRAKNWAKLHLPRGGQIQPLLTVTL